MPAKPKPAKSKKAEGLLESKLSMAIELISANKAAEAIPIFEAVAAEATNVGNFGVARVAGNYIAHEKHKKTAPIEVEPLQEAVFLLNDKQPEAALDKLDIILKNENTNANAHYLKSLAFAKLQKTELAADSLKSAIGIDPALLHVYRLEPEFKLCRRSPTFTGFELD
ncbi:MAG: hypothetical protein LBQ86_00650 [Holophagales bacterium]|jgi:tetratricopeptide (TPR) repeat protein|nr:hypothetical protein [Holophagales bacterium]